MSVAAIVVAGGRGVRFGGLKQFASIGDVNVAQLSVVQCRSVADTVILVVPEGYSGTGEGADVVVVGGESRASSVRAGLAQVSADITVVHDAARPAASPSLFRDVVDAVIEGADGAIPGLVVSDTVKRVHTVEGRIIVNATVPREDLMTVQTPQAFRTTQLRQAHTAFDDATDDAALIERIGGTVVVVPGEITNIKITHPHDVEIVRRWWEAFA